MPGATYKVRLEPAPYEQLVEQLQSNDEIPLGGPAPDFTPEGSIEQNAIAQSSPIKFGADTAENFADEGNNATLWSATGEASAPTDNGSDFVVAGGSINMGKSGTGGQDFYYERDHSRTDLLNTDAYFFRFKITAAAKSVLSDIKLFLMNDGLNFYMLPLSLATIPADEWVQIGDVIENWNTEGSPGTTIYNIIIDFATVNASDTITHGDILLDSVYWYPGCTIHDRAESTTNWSTPHGETIRTTSTRIEGDYALEGGIKAYESMAKYTRDNSSTGGWNLKDKAFHMAIRAPHTGINRIDLAFYSEDSIFVYYKIAGEDIPLSLIHI